MKLSAILRALVPSVSQLLAVGAILTTGVLAYNAGTRTSTSQPAVPAPTVKGPSLHPVDVNGDGIIYISPMHPQIQQDEPGNCPICGMELVATKVGDVASAPPDNPTAHAHANEPIGYACAMNCVPPLEEPGDCPVCGMEMQPVSMEPSFASDQSSPRQLTMSSEAVALANVETTTVRRGAATQTISMVGQLVEDPQRRFHLSANVGGRIDVLHARFDRDTVEAGQTVAEIYSPELLAVQEELLQAKASMQRWDAEGNTPLARTARESVDIIRRRLLLAGLGEEQIAAILAGGKALDRLALTVPVAGIVTARYVEQGQYIEREQRIVTISDYAVLWAELEAFNSDLPSLKKGTSVSITTSVLADRVYTGEVDWIDPLTTTDSRTTLVRVVLENADLALRPGMYIRAAASVAVGGDSLPLLIPHTAPLITGRRAVVYTMDPDSERPTFVGREVELGARVEEGYVVLSGLAEGDRVVTRGAFQIDSSLQILARPSMMNPQGGVPVDGHAGHGSQSAEAGIESEHPAALAGALNVEGARLVLPLYLKVQTALAADDADAAKREWAPMVDAIARSGDHALHGLVDGDASANIASMRLAFEAVSQKLIPHLTELGQPIVHVHCPMAFDWKGADWLQVGREVTNPYFGAEMLRCGTIKGEVEP